jgi:hypothetical protein
VIVVPETVTMPFKAAGRLGMEYVGVTVAIVPGVEHAHATAGRVFVLPS